MPFTASDLDNIKAAIASGELMAQVADRRVQYRDMDDLLKAKAMIEQDIAAQAAQSAPRQGNGRFTFITARER